MSGVMAPAVHIVSVWRQEGIWQVNACMCGATGNPQAGGAQQWHLAACSSLATMRPWGLLGGTYCVGRYKKRRILKSTSSSWERCFGGGGGGGGGGVSCEKEVAGRKGELYTFAGETSPWQDRDRITEPQLQPVKAGSLLCSSCMALTAESDGALQRVIGRTCRARRLYKIRLRKWLCQGHKYGDAKMIRTSSTLCNKCGSDSTPKPCTAAQQAAFRVVVTRLNKQERVWTGLTWAGTPQAYRCDYGVTAKKGVVWSDQEEGGVLHAMVRAISMQSVELSVCSVRSNQYAGYGVTIVHLPGKPQIQANSLSEPTALELSKMHDSADTRLNWGCTASLSFLTNKKHMQLLLGWTKRLGRKHAQMLHMRKPVKTVGSENDQPTLVLSIQAKHENRILGKLGSLSEAEQMLEGGMTNLFQSCTSCATRGLCAGIA
eukprot:1141689-Pelagomonas_calceolata.AAC.1